MKTAERRIDLRKAKRLLDEAEAMLGGPDAVLTPEELLRASERAVEASRALGFLVPRDEDDDDEPAPSPRYLGGRRAPSRVGRTRGRR